MYVCMYVCLYVCMYVFMHACMHVFMYTYMYIVLLLRGKEAPFEGEKRLKFFRLPRPGKPRTPHLPRGRPQALRCWSSALAPMHNNLSVQCEEARGGASRGDGEVAALARRLSCLVAILKSQCPNLITYSNTFPYCRPEAPRGWSSAHARLLQPHDRKDL